MRRISEALQELLASAKEAFDTPNFSQQVETAAKLDIAMEDFDREMAWSSTRYRYHIRQWQA